MRHAKYTHYLRTRLPLLHFYIFTYTLASDRIARHTGARCSLLARLKLFNLRRPLRAWTAGVFSEFLHPTRDFVVLFHSVLTHTHDSFAAR
jgi:hypothetical protein